jgi:hypothetical protein
MEQAEPVGDPWQAGQKKWVNLARELLPDKAAFSGHLPLELPFSKTILEAVR